MREALDGTANEELRFSELYKLASAEKEPTKSILLANLGARLSSLSPRNPGWQVALQRASSDPSSPGAVALAGIKTLSTKRC
jgi:hypothetical protein